MVVPAPDPTVQCPVFNGSVRGHTRECTADTAAIISIIKDTAYPGQRPPESRIKLKGSVPGTASLFGPVQDTLEFGGHKFNHTFFITDSPSIETDILLGIDFLHKFGCLIDCGNSLLHVTKHQDGAPLSKRLKLKVKIVKPSTKHRENFTAGCLYYTIRTANTVTLHPFSEVGVRVNLKTTYGPSLDTPDLLAT